MTVDYHRYMASREWALKREEVKERADGVCERCHDARIQSTHHLTYQRLGKEQVDTDLLGVCNPCHEFLSGKRDDDPAIAVVLRLFDTQLIAEAGMREISDARRIWLKIGPTQLGEYLIGILLNTGTRGNAIWDNFRDDALLVVSLGEGIWFHCFREME